MSVPLDISLINHPGYDDAPNDLGGGGNRQKDASIVCMTQLHHRVPVLLIVVGLAEEKIESKKCLISRKDQKNLLFPRMAFVSTACDSVLTPRYCLFFCILHCIKLMPSYGMLIPYADTVELAHF